MERWRWRGGNGEVETGERGEAAKLEDGGGRERLLGWRRLVQGEAVKLEEVVDGKVKMVRWR